MIQDGIKHAPDLREGRDMIATDGHDYELVVHKLEVGRGIWRFVLRSGVTSRVWYCSDAEPLRWMDRHLASELNSEAHAS